MEFKVSQRLPAFSSGNFNLKNAFSKVGNLSFQTRLFTINQSVDNNAAFSV